MRNLPIFTFMNKLDRPARDPLSLIDELEQTLQLHVCAMNWPLGDGPSFQGVYDRQERLAHFFERTAGGAFRAPVAVHDVTDPQVRERLPEKTYHTLLEELEMLNHAGEIFDPVAVRKGDLTPIFFGSAINNFGVQLLLDSFLEHAPAPQPRQSRTGLITPEHPPFSGFIFKIQSNMNPRHRDQIAFVRVCSGRFTRDMQVTHTRTGNTLRLSSSHKLFARERETVDEAFPGDVIGLVGHEEFGIGDTLTEDPAIEYHEIPRFAPECFAYLHNPSTAHFKRFRAGLSHLLQEGVVQSFELPNSVQRVALLGAVGPLQFEVLQYRLDTEYGAKSRLEPAPWAIIRWLDTGGTPAIEDSLPGGCRLAQDATGQTVALFASDWQLNLFAERNPKLVLHRLPPSVAR